MNNYGKNASKRLCMAAALLTATVFSASASAGGDAFKAKCVGCHGADGGGQTALGTKLKLRDLRSAEVQKQSDAELESIVEKGKTPMPAFGKTLGAPAVQELVAYMRTIAAK